MQDMTTRQPRISGMIRLTALLLVVGLFAFWSSCTPVKNDVDSGPSTADSGPADSSSSTVDTTPPTERTTPPKTELTYHKDIRPILEKSCMGCHKEGGIGPFALASHKQVFGLRQVIKSSIQNGNMPPWPADEKSCREYKHSMGLTDKEKKTILDWIEADAPEGDPKSYKKPSDSGVTGIDRVDVELKMPEAYKPQTAPDDYRCFVLPWPKTKTAYVTGFQIKAGNPKIVHHVIAYLATAKQKDKLKQLDDAESGPGYTCYGGPKVDANWLAAWAPGKPGGLYPEGTGIKVEPGSQIIIQLHYNTLTDNPTPDQTAVQLKLADKVEKEAYIVPISHTKWLIPAKQKEYKTSKLFDNEIGKNFKIDVEIHSASLHLHMLGTSARFYIKREDGTEECLLNIPKWDFNWQYFYDFKQTVTIRPGDKVGIECSWDNSPENQALVNGKRLTSRDVKWGDGSTDEMCLGVVYITSSGLSQAP
jgi:hypothetical protein